MLFVDQDKQDHSDDILVHNDILPIKSKSKIGLFGGSFNPAHEWHFQVAKNALNEYSDGTLIIYNSSFNEISKVHFKDVFPISLSTIEFDATAGDINYVTATATFKYSIYNIEVMT